MSTPTKSVATEAAIAAMIAIMGRAWVEGWQSACCEERIRTGTGSQEQSRPGGTQRRGIWIAGGSGGCATPFGRCKAVSTVEDSLATALQIPDPIRRPLALRVGKPALPIAIRHPFALDPKNRAIYVSFTESGRGMGYGARVVGEPRPVKS